jgi:protein-serine/threonine kinase
MLSAAAVDLTFDADEWPHQPITARFYKAASVGSWAVTSIGRGFNWNQSDEDVKQSPKESPNNIAKLEALSQCSPLDFPFMSDGSLAKQQHSFIETPKVNYIPTPTFRPLLIMPSATHPEVSIVQSPMRSRSSSPIVASPSIAVRPLLARTPSSPRPRRRSSQQRVSLVAGRVLIAPMDQALAPELQPLRRTNSSSSGISTAQSTRPPSPSTEGQSFLGEKRITDFMLESEIGRGAYGLVKRGREIHKDSTLGVRIGPSIL